MADETWQETALRRESMYKLWKQFADEGQVPRIQDMATEMFDLTVPWFWNDHFLPALSKIGSDLEKKFLEAWEVARGHGKTMCSHLMTMFTATFIIPYIEHARSANRTILVIGRDEVHAHDLMDELHQSICEYTPWLKYNEWALMGEEPEEIYNQGMKGGGRKWGVKRMDLTNGISIRGFSINQSVRRFHCYLAVIDDLVTEENFMDGQWQMERIEGAVLKAIEPGGLVLMEGTPQDDEDAYTKARDNPKWNHVQLPGKGTDYIERNQKAVRTGELPPHPSGKEYTADDMRCLWPWRMNARQHQWERGSTRETQLLYDREILLKRVSLADSLVDPNDIYAAKDASLYYVRHKDDDPNEHRYAGGVDPSALSRSDAAIVIGTQSEDGVLVPRHWNVVEARGANRSKDSTLEVCQEINNSSMAFGNPPMQVESNQFQEMLEPVSRILINPDVQLENKHLGGDKNEKSGWVSIRTLFANGKVKLPYGPTPQEKVLIDQGLMDPNDCEAVRLTDMFISQLQRIRRKDGKVITPRGLKDDMVSAFYQFKEMAAEEFGVDGGGAAVGGLESVIGVTHHRGGEAVSAEHRKGSQQIPTAMDRVRKAQNLNHGLRRRFMR